MSWQQLVRDNLPRTLRYARGHVARIFGTVDRGAIVGAACVGLVQAAKRYKAGYGVRCWTFAQQRIRGAIADELRGQDFLTRAARIRGETPPRFKRIGAMSLISPNGAPVAAAIKAEIRELVRREVFALPARERGIIVGYYFHHRLSREMAEEQGCDASRISQLKRKAQERLKRRLAYLV